MTEIRNFIIYAASLGFLLLSLIASAFALFVDLWFATPTIPLHLIACVFLFLVMIRFVMTHKIGKLTQAGFLAAGLVIVEVSVRYVNWA